MKKILFICILFVSLFFTRPVEAKAFSLRGFFGGSGSKETVIYKQCVQSSTEARNQAIERAKKQLSENLKFARAEYEKDMANANTKRKKTAASKQLQVRLKSAQKEYDQTEKNATSDFKNSSKICKK